jgi:soluble lytic murein transglycosylase-like protein
MKHLMGFGVLVLTLVSGYAISGFAGARGPRPVESALVIDIEACIATAAARYGVSQELIVAIIEAESEFNPRAVSRRGAQGLMQLMPETAATLGVNDPFDPRANIDGGVRHLRAMMDRFDNNLPLALAAYNAGEVAVIKHRGVPPYRETRGYVNRILRKLDRDVAPTRELSRT